MVKIYRHNKCKEWENNISSLEGSVDSMTRMEN